MRINAKLLESKGRSNKRIYVYKLTGSAGRQAVGAHWHEEFEALYTDCDGLVDLDATVVPFERDGFVFINKDQLHQITTHSEGLVYAVVFDFEFLEFKNDDYCQTEIIGTLKHKTRVFPQSADMAPALRKEVAALLRGVVGLYYAKPPGWELKVKCNLYEIIFLLYTNEQFVLPPAAKHNLAQLDYVRNTISYMENNYSSNISITDLAKHVNLCKYYLVKVFKHVTGETPIVYLRNLRIDNSKEMLGKGISVTKTALMCGFNNVSYYIRHFKALNHVSPKEYQRARNMSL